jgi:hypothetical protein
MVPEIEGRKVPWTETRWVCINPKGEAIGVMNGDSDLKDDIGKAARRYWKTWQGVDPVIKAQEGYRLLMTDHEGYSRDYYPGMLGGFRTEHEGKPGIFIPDRSAGQ